MSERTCAGGRIYICSFLTSGMDEDLHGEANAQYLRSTCAVPILGQDCDPDPTYRFFSKYRNPFITIAVGFHVS